MAATLKQAVNGAENNGVRPNDVVWNRLNYVLSRHGVAGRSGVGGDCLVEASSCALRSN